MNWATGELVERREKVLSMIPHFTAPLSMIGSSVIAFHIIRKMRSNTKLKSYHFIVLSMAFADIVSSFAYSFSTLAMPPGPAPRFMRPHRYGAIGNEQTCTAQGFGILFGVTVAFFNLLLSIHYLLVIRCRVLDRASRNELHGRQPNRECMAKIWRLRKILYVAPLWTCVGLVTLVQLAIWWTVQTTEIRANKWRFEEKTRSFSIDSFESGISTQGSSSATFTRPVQRPVQGLRRMSQLTRKAEARAKKYAASSRVVAFQSSLYLSSFYVCWLPLTLAVKLLQGQKDILRSNYFWLYVCVVTLQPLQGFCNSLIFFQSSIHKAWDKSLVAVARKGKERRATVKAAPTASRNGSEGRLLFLRVLMLRMLSVRT